MKRRGFTTTLALLLAAGLFAGLTACSAPPADSDASSAQTAEKSDNANVGTVHTDRVTERATDQTTEGEDEMKQNVPDLVIACDQAQNRVVVYDMAEYDGVDLDHHELWSYKPASPACKNISGVKYREGTVFGDVVVIVASGGYAGIIRYPQGEPVWEIPLCGNNPHSIEILPDGNVVTASSAGELVLFRTSVLVSDPTAEVTKKQYTLPDAHGVLWDPDYELLWAVGETELAAYQEKGDPAEATLQKVDGFGAALPSKSGHALSADLTDTNYLWVSANGGVYRFDKENRVFEEKYEGYRTLNRKSTKGFGITPNGNFFQCVAVGGKGTAWENAAFQSWCTPSLHYYQRGDKGILHVTVCKSSTCAYYKSYPFYGQYQ